MVSKIPGQVILRFWLSPTHITLRKTQSLLLTSSLGARQPHLETWPHSSWLLTRGRYLLSPGGNCLPSQMERKSPLSLSWTLTENSACGHLVLDTDQSWHAKWLSFFSKVRERRWEHSYWCILTNSCEPCFRRVLNLNNLNTVMRLAERMINIHWHTIVITHN